MADPREKPSPLDAARARVGFAGIAGLVVVLLTGHLGLIGRAAVTATFGPGWSRKVDTLRAAMRGNASQPRKGTSSMNILTGYKTYIVGAAMLVAGVAQLVGVALPAFSSQSAGDLLMQGLAIIFLRQGITNTIAKG